MRAENEAVLGAKNKANFPWNFVEVNACDSLPGIDFLLQVHRPEGN